MDSKVATELFGRARIVPPYIPPRKVCNYKASGCFEAFLARHPVWVVYKTSARHYYPENNEMYFRSNQSIAFYRSSNQAGYETFKRVPFDDADAFPHQSRPCMQLYNKTVGRILSFNVTSYYIYVRPLVHLVSHMQSTRAYSFLMF